jgi:hypothetical protein
MDNKLRVLENKSDIVLFHKDDLMIRYLQLRKIAISYWDIFAFSFGFCLIFPLVNRLSLGNFQKTNVIASLGFSYFFYKFNLKYIVKTMNRNEYNKFKIFCKKYQLEEEILF